MEYSLLCFNRMMETKSLQSVLETKYQLQEKLYVEGLFVCLFGNTNDALGLVSIGIGRSFFVVAKVNLARYDIDFDLISITPLSLMSFTCHDQSKRLVVESSFKPTQVFQVCSSARQAEIWDSFTTHIRALRTELTPNTWLKSSLTTSGKSPQARPWADLDNAMMFSELYTNQAQEPLFCHNLNNRKSGVHLLTPNNTLLSYIEKGDGDGVSHNIHTRCQSETLLFSDIKFDSFVNDAPALNRSNNNSTEPNTTGLLNGDNKKQGVIKIIGCALSTTCGFFPGRKT